MPRRRQRKTAKPAPPRGAAVSDFAGLARTALARGRPDAIPDALLQQIFAAAVKVYAAKVEQRGAGLNPVADGAITATESVVAACGLIRAADLNMFDVAMWFHRPPA